MPARVTTAAPETGRLSFADLAGWAEDDLDAALAAYRGNPAAAEGPGRAFFEERFRPGPSVAAHGTGYYEPELDAGRERSEAFPVPIHGHPSGGFDAVRVDADRVLAGHELAWLRDEVDRFFLQVQGSGRLRFADGTGMRVGYAGTNGHPYRSIGRIAVARGLLEEGLTAEGLTAWLRADFARGRALMAENPSYVTFAARDLDLESGPLGTLCPVTAGRSVAVDPEHVPLGTPVWVELGSIARLCIAQDTGSAIRGAGRIDLFFGTGAAAGRVAGALNARGRIVPLLTR